MAFSDDAPAFILSPFEQALIESGYLSLSQIHQALSEAHRTGIPLPQLVEGMVGESLPQELHRQYEAQQRFALMVIHGVPFLSPGEMGQRRDLKAIAGMMGRCFPLPLCRQYGVVPLPLGSADSDEASTEEIWIGMVDPSDGEAYQFALDQLARQGLTAQRRGLTREDYDAILDQIYQDPELLRVLMANPEGKKDPERPPATVVDVTEVMDEFPPPLTPETAPAPPPTPAMTEDSPVAQLANKILIKGLREGSREIHLDPQETQWLVRINQGGTLRPLIDPLPAELGKQVVQRLKTLGQLDLAQTQIPQKGRLRKSYNGRPVYFFIHSLPSFYGEKIFVRIVPAPPTWPDWADLCDSASTQHELKSLATGHRGLLVLTGPAYSGKSTTLETILGYQVKQGLTVGSVEDPMGHAHPQITQMALDNQTDLTPAQAIAKLAECCEVIGVDSGADAETVAAIAQVLPQGRLVVMTLAAKDSAAAIAQLQQWMAPALLGEYLIGVVGQRLVRRVCPQCRLGVKATAEHHQRYGLAVGRDIYQANSLSPDLIASLQMKQRLCDQCHGVGYAGVTGVFEILPLTPACQPVIRRPCASEDLRSAFQQWGVVSLRQSAIALVQEGITSLEEVTRLFPHSLERLSPPPSQSSAAPTVDLLPRIQGLEQCVNQLQQALTDLKQSLVPSAPSSSRPSMPAPAPASPPPRVPSVDLLPELEALEHLSAQKRPKKESLEPEEESTLIRDFADLEELLVDDAAPSPPPNESRQDPDPLHPFKSIVDPW